MSASPRKPRSFSAPGGGGGGGGPVSYTHLDVYKRQVLGLTSATDGKIFFQGEDITFAKGHARRELQKKMQIIFQDPFSSLNPRYTVFELIANPIRTFRLCRGKAETERKVFELMDTVGLARRFAYALSLIHI